MTKHISIVFPGQGSQSIGMLDQFSNVDILSSGYDTDIFSFDLLNIISTDEEKLNQSQYTQPALVLSSHLYFRKLTKLLSDKFNLLAGHSLGEFSALLAAGSIEFKYCAWTCLQKRFIYVRSSKRFHVSCDGLKTISNRQNLY